MAMYYYEKKKITKRLFTSHSLQKCLHLTRVLRCKALVALQRQRTYFFLAVDSFFGALVLTDFSTAGTAAVVLLASMNREYTIGGMQK